VLVYATGGFAYGGVHNSQVDNRPINFTVDTTATGYTVGGGVEYKFTPAWSVKAEYQYINLGKNDPVSPIQGAFTSFRTTLDDDAYHTVRVGVNYQFH
jgi:outer membrane immunogenic protein